MQPWQTAKWRVRVFSSSLSSGLAPAELERAEARGDRAAHGSAFERAAEDPVARLGLALPLHRERELDRRSVQTAAVNVAGAFVARERAGEDSVLVVQRDHDPDVALRRANGQAPGAVDCGRAALCRLLLRRREPHFTAVDEFVRDLRVLVEDRLVADDD